MFKDCTLPRVHSRTRWALVTREKGGGGSCPHYTDEETDPRKDILLPTLAPTETLSPGAKATTLWCPETMACEL